ncbi:MAG: hypothetical protein V3575_01290 [Candidatus Absconditabacteria bacterium]
MDKEKLCYMIKQSGVSIELQNELIELLNNNNIDKNTYLQAQQLLQIHDRDKGGKINTVKQIVSYSLSLILDNDTKVLDNLKDNFLVALQDYPIEQIERALNVLDSYYSDVRQDKSMRKGIDTKAISRIRNLCAVFGSFDIYDILANRIEFIDYHLVNSWSDSLSQESRLDGAKVKNYFVIKDKVTGNIIIVGDSIQLLYKDFNVILPNDANLLKTNRIELIKTTKYRNLNSKLNSLTDESKYESTKDLATKSLSSNGLENDFLISSWLLQKLNEITIKIDKGEYGELIKSFNPKRNYINWLIEVKSKNELPKYIVDLIKKLSSINDELTSQEMLILFSYYARESTIDLESIPNIVENIKFFIDQGEQIPNEIQSLINQKTINQVQLLQILDRTGKFLSQAKSLNLKTIKKFELENEIKIKDIVKNLFPLVSQIRKEYSTDMLYFNLILSNSSDRSTISWLKNIMKVWTIGINSVDDFDFGSKLINNISGVESISSLENYLSIFLLEHRKYNLCCNLNKSNEIKIADHINNNIPKVDSQTTWSQLNSNFNKDVKSKFSINKLPKGLIRIEDLKDKEGNLINYFDFVDKVSKTYFPSNSNTSSCINSVILGLTNFTKHGLFPIDKLSNFLYIYNLYNKQGFLPRLEENQSLYEEFEFFIGLGSFISVMYYPKSILTKDYVNPSVNEKIQQIVNTCKDYFEGACREEIVDVYNQFMNLSQINKNKNIVFYGNSSNPYSTYFMLNENAFPVDYKNINGVRFVNISSLKTRLNQVSNDYISFEKVKINYPELINDLDKYFGEGFIQDMRICLDHKSILAFRDLIIWPHNNTVLVPIKLINIIQSIIQFYKK